MQTDSHLWSRAENGGQDLGHKMPPGVRGDEEQEVGSGELSTHYSPSFSGGHIEPQRERSRESLLKEMGDP